LYQQLALKLTAVIQAGVYKIGDRLPAERDLATEYQLSRPTVREALIALEVQGLVEARIGSGVYVKRKAPQQGSPGFDVSAFELTEARLMFEGETAALAATLITDEELDELESLVERIDHENRIPGGNEQADRDFHLLIAKATRNTAVMLQVESLWRQRQSSPECALLLEKARTAKVKPVVAEHTAIIKALRSRVPEKARDAMRAHLSAVMKHLLFQEQLAKNEAGRPVQATKSARRRTRGQVGQR
jgi:GntR family hexuronate regulon transcriptional repressor